jgi:hypothetical protein
MPTSGGDGEGQSIPYVGTPGHRPLLNILVPCLRHAGTPDRSRGQAGVISRGKGGQKKCIIGHFFVDLCLKNVKIAAC